MHKPMIQRILIAESDRMLREDYFEYLYRYAIKIEMASDGLECICKIRSHLPDLLILDLELPWGRGDGVLGIMREDPRYSKVPVILTSPNIFPPEMLQSPVVKTLVKPINPLSLLSGTDFATQPTSDPDLLVPEDRIVLVVDDEPSIRKLLQRHLEQQGFQVWTVGCGEEAIRLLGIFSEQIAVVLLDVQMRDLDGPQTLDRLLDCKPDLPVCFITGDAGEYEYSDLICRGARHVFLKPFNLKKITQIVQSYLKESRVRVTVVNS